MKPAAAQGVRDAIKRGDVAALEPIWAYIESTRGKAPSFDDSQLKVIDADALRLRGDGIAILSRGVLEDYLPIGLRDKDQDKLIAFLGGVNWLAQLPAERSEEIREICAFVAA
jgi:hypothetical protein